MIGRLKYIIIDSAKPIIFSAGISHAAFTSHLSFSSLLMISDGSNKITSAGFIKLFPDGNGGIDCACYGESESLKLKARPEDAEILRAVMGFE